MTLTQSSQTQSSQTQSSQTQSRTRQPISRIYLDHAATTPIRPEAEAAMREGFAIWANPSSPHAEGRKAKAALEDARGRVKKALDWDGEVIFTSGASEAAELALTRAKGGARLVSAVEHDAILKAAPTAERLPVRSDGALDLEILREAVDGRAVPVVAVQQINSETGCAQDLGIIGDIVHDAGGLLLVDCAQSAGKMPLHPASDMAIISAHKFGGPIGIGALLVCDFAMLEPAGGQERGYRRGTENMPAALAMAAALEACGDSYLPPDVLEPLNAMQAQVTERGGVWLSDQLAAPTNYIRSIAMKGMSGGAQLMRFDMAGIAVSQGSACSSGSLRQSHVLEAMALDEDMIGRTIRASFGWNTARGEVERFCAVWLDMAKAAA